MTKYRASLKSIAMTTSVVEFNTKKECSDYCKLQNDKLCDHDKNEYGMEFIVTKVKKSIFYKE